MIDWLNVFACEYQYVFNIIMSVATLWMCYFSYRNIKITRQETMKQTLQDEIECFLYSAMCYVRNDIEKKIEVKTRLLKYYIAMFMLKKNKICDNGDIILDNKFINGVQTTKDESRLIYDKLFFPPCLNCIEDRYQYYQELTKIIQCYCRNFQSCKNLYQNIINDINDSPNNAFSVEKIFLIDPNYKIDRNDKLEKMFNELVNYYVNQFRLKYMSFLQFSFKNFYIPFYKNLYEENKQILKNGGSIYAIWYLQKEFSCQQYVETMNVYNTNDDDLVKYNKLQSSINSELSRGFIRKLTKDFADLGLIYLPNCSIIKRLWLKFKQNREFRKISKFLPKENGMADPMKYLFAYLLGSGELMLQWETVNTQKIHKSSIEKLKKLKQIILNLILKRKKTKTYTSQAASKSIKGTL